MPESPAKRRKIKDTGRAAPAPKITDPRFANIQSDPRYRLPSKRHTHVKLDNRFSRILEDDDFVRKAKVDRYGRPLDTSSERQRLKRRYEFEEDEEDDDDPDDDNDVQKELQRVQTTRDPLREGLASVSSSDESSSEEDELEEEADGNGRAEPLEDQVPTGEVSSRIAVVNLDWDNIRAEDLMAVFSSFVPAPGRLLKVTIYPSEFGRERMEREEMEGPPKEIFATTGAKNEDLDDEGDESEDDEEIKRSILKPDKGDEFDSGMLRRYQLERLRYFYAVLSFSSSTAAKVVYDAVDGTEYLSTANFFDLRFVPDETDFTSDKPREECKKIPEGYKPTDFVTDALQHSKVKLTWDAEDGSRKEAQARAFRGGRKEIDENDLKAYLGSDSSEDEADAVPSVGKVSGIEDKGSKKEEERRKMRALLGLGAEPVKKSKSSDGPVGDLQITFSSGFAGSNGEKRSVFENEPEETTVERYIRKERERKQRRKVKHDVDGPAQDRAQAPASDQGRSVEADGDDLGFDDPFFQATENDKTSASKIRKEERLKKKVEREAEESANAAKRAELELLMVDDTNTEVRHFDMNEIEKAEKRAEKKGKHRKKDQVQHDADVEDDFKMDTDDPRFARLYDNHEFAIDPTNPRFKGTTGMKALLEKGRKRRNDIAD
jgi:hypothetical protein